MAVRRRDLEDADTPPRHAGKTAKKIAEATKKGVLVQLEKKSRKPLRSGQRHRTRTKKIRPVTSYAEAAEVEARANKIIGTDSWRLHRLAPEKILYLFSTAERINGCLEGIISASRYPRKFRYKTTLRYEFLVVVAKPRWDRATDTDKTRLTYHALRHLGHNSGGARRVEGHDIEGFISEVEFFGLRSPEIKRIAEQLDLFQHRPFKAGESNGKEE
jgi:hypothetical protein